ncbi:serine/threonine protein kinase [Bdellovibrio bacteriovorus]|uniref:serine/threonine protein kinase n=1 Tax=Bdellovibrio bacteriovorus TaxID=959 RepID=UPI0035A57CA4
MADIFLVKKVGGDPSQTFVLKKVAGNVNDKWYYSKLFLREAKLSLSLTHKNLVRTFEMGAHGDDLYLIQEYINGVNLRDVTRVSEAISVKVPPEMTYYILTEIAFGLSYMHGEVPGPQNQVFVHRDLSPHNIMLSRDGEVKIIDFGISKSYASESLTQVGAVRGKYSYMSPEQIQGASLTAASDIFGLGIIFYELLTGKRFFGTVNEVEIVRILDAWSDANVEEKLMDVSGEDQEILRRMIAPDFKDRASSSQLTKLFAGRLKALNDKYDKASFALSLRELVGDAPDLESDASVPVATHEAISLNQITLYDVLTRQEKKTSAIPLFMIFIGMAVAGLHYWKYKQEEFAEQKRSLAAVAPPQKKSMLMNFRNFSNEFVKIFVNNEVIEGSKVKTGFKVYDGDTLVIKYYSHEKNKWLSQQVVVDTSKPLNLVLDL